MVVGVSLHHQQIDNFCKIQKKNAMWTGAVIYVGRFIVLLSSGAPCMCVCYTALRERGVCPLQGYWLLSLFTWPILTSILFVRGTGRNWTAGLVTTGCLAVRLRLWQPLHTFKTSLNWTDVDLTILIRHYQCQKQVQIFRRAAATLVSCMVDSLCHHSHRLSNVYWEETQALYATLDLNSARSLRNEIQYCRALNGVLWRKG